jgi:trans-L-3-hydroxyproline dehydratase
VHASVSVDASILGTRRSVPVDVAYGGAFYAICDAKDTGVDVHTSAVADLVTASQQLCARVREVVPLSHPEPELAFLYGAIFTDGADAFSEVRHIAAMVYRAASIV